MIEQAAVRHNLSKQAVEKDLWVSAMLQILFSLPCAESMVFKGGTSLTKGWGLINRFSEDIDVAIDRSIFGLDGDLTKKQVKKLRKESSLFVKDILFRQISEKVTQFKLNDWCEIEAQPDGTGDNTYPEPRTIFVKYHSVFADKIPYISPDVKIEVGARSLLEPTTDIKISSLIESALSAISTTIIDVPVRTAIAEKTFLEKAFLLHELFSVREDEPAKRRSRHLYDLHMMMQKGLAEKAIKDDELWETIHYHRASLTSMQGVDYSSDFRDRIKLVPPAKCIKDWQRDYEDMAVSMIYKNPPAFSTLLESMEKLESIFKNRK